jgi:MFS family permease
VSEAPEAEDGEAHAEITISRGYSYYVLGVMFFVYVFNFIDRQVLAIMLTPIKEEIGVSDTAMGFLTGFAFVIFYTLAGLPIARWADRSSRRSIIALGLTVWSSMTALSGLVQNFGQLAAARIGVGVGEAAGTPPAHSLISDYFEPKVRATALSVYATGVYVGVAVAFIGGSWLASNFGWRMVYIVLGCIGLPMALIVRFTVKELPRGFSDPVKLDIPQVPFAEAFSTILRNRSFRLIVLATACQSLSGYGMLAWGPTFLIRVHEMDIVEAGWTLGIAIGTMGVLGAYLGGIWSDKLGARDERWYMRLPAIQSVLGVPFGIGFILLDDITLAMWCFYPFYILGAMYVGPMFSMIQSVVVPNQRATASAINLFIVNMIGLGLGPFLIGLLNDRFTAEYGQEAIRYSMLISTSVGGFASFIFYRASQALPEDLAAARAGQGV